jgi:hypothetical protein
MIRYIFLFFCFSAQATSLRVGDVLLQPLDCWACSLIEAEERTIYSHMGVVIQTTPQVMVAEAYGRVRQVDLEEFDRKTQRGQKLMVLRFRNNKLSRDFMDSEERLRELFVQEFLGAKYDGDFLWHNMDERGVEKHYCSELVSKLFKAFMGLETPIKRMHFNQNREQWMVYFKGNIPDNQWGNSPGDFERSEMFYKLGEL